MMRFVYLLVAGVLSAYGQPPVLTLEDIWQKSVFHEKRVEGMRSMNDGLYYTTLGSAKAGQFIIRHAYSTGKTEDTLLHSERLVWNSDTLHIDEYHFSPDERRILIATGTEPIYRHSTKAEYYMWDREQEKLTLLSAEGKQQYPTFSPEGDKAAFVRNNNLFIKNLLTGEETAVTADGKQNHIINGVTDWVYEEELEFTKAFFWSPDGKKIAFYRFDESGVKEFSIDRYGSLYPDQSRFKYPKAGEANSHVGIHVYDLASGKALKVAETHQPFLATEKEKSSQQIEYIPRIKWTADTNALAILLMNRHQNFLELRLVNAVTGNSRTVLTETRPEHSGWIDITDDLTFSADGKNFIWASDRDGFNHIYFYSIAGKLIRQITRGNWDVEEYYGVDEKQGLLYYTSSEPGPMHRALYVIGLDGKNKRLLSPETGVLDAEFSKGFQYYTEQYTNISTPLRITLHKSDGTLIRIMEDNNALRDTLNRYDIAKPEFFSFTTTAGTVLNGWMTKPQKFDQAKKYPVIMFVYGGPGSQTVRDAWGGAQHLWYQLLVQKGFIVVSVDNRGTGARGAVFKKCTYRELGKLETEDQIDAAKYLASLPYVDKSRIGIWGWSYGGYMTLLCMTKGAEYFKMGISVAPVTNWRFYDTIYTERYLQTPQENPGGYDDNSPINHAEKLRGKLLLVHGSADDNVHLQNTMEMVKALVAANKQFDLFIYPDRNHDIYGGNTRLHLFTKMTEFIMENL